MILLPQAPTRGQTLYAKNVYKSKSPTTKGTKEGTKGDNQKCVCVCVFYFIFQQDIKRIQLTHKKGKRNNYQTNFFLNKKTIPIAVGNLPLPLKTPCTFKKHNWENSVAYIMNTLVEI